MPFTANIKTSPTLFHRFEAIWTPTILVLSPQAVERFRIEGYLPRPEFEAKLQLALARVSFMAKQFGEAQPHYQKIIESYKDTTSAPEAIYWDAVCTYQITHDHLVLGKVTERLKPYPYTEWTAKASVWSDAH